MLKCPIVNYFELPHLVQLDTVKGLNNMDVSLGLFYHMMNLEDYVFL